MRDVKKIEDTYFKRSKTSDINYEGCKGNVTYLPFSSSLSQILTMRDVKRKILKILWLEKLSDINYEGCKAV